MVGVVVVAVAAATTTTKTRGGKLSLTCNLYGNNIK